MENLRSRKYRVIHKKGKSSKSVLQLLRPYFFSRRYEKVAECQQRRFSKVTRLRPPVDWLLYSRVSILLSPLIRSERREVGLTFEVRWLRRVAIKRPKTVLFSKTLPISVRIWNYFTLAACYDFIKCHANNFLVLNSQNILKFIIESCELELRLKHYRRVTGYLKW